MSLQQPHTSVPIALADPSTGIPGSVTEIFIPLPSEGQPLSLANVVDFLSTHGTDQSTPLRTGTLAPERDPSRAGRAQVRLWIPDPASTPPNR
jgi:hypothetical protein